jgi:hypothetical protein
MESKKMSYLETLKKGLYNCTTELDKLNEITQEGLENIKVKYPEHYDSIISDRIEYSNKIIELEEEIEYLSQMLTKDELKYLKYIMDNFSPSNNLTPYENRIIASAFNKLDNLDKLYNK